MWYIGIDIDKKMCHGCIKEKNGNIKKELKFPNKNCGMDKLLEALEGREAKAVIESTGNMWLRLYPSLEELLMGIPGVDYYIALLFTSEVGDYSRFSSANKLISWLGLAPRVHQSGDTSYNGRITKEGSPSVMIAKF